MFYKTSVNVSVYNWTTESTSELSILTRLAGFQQTKGASNVFPKAFLNSSLKCVLNIRTEFTKYPIKEYYKYYNLIQIPIIKDCLSYLQPLIRNGLPDDVKLPKNANTFKHKVKKSFLTSKYLCILWVDYRHHHFILIMEL